MPPLFFYNLYAVVYFIKLWRKMTCFTSLTAHRPQCFFPQVFHWALLYLEKARQSFFSQTAEAKNMADFWWLWCHFTPYPWQRLMLVTASQAQIWHKIAIYRSESPHTIFAHWAIYFVMFRQLASISTRHAKRSGMLWQVSLITFSDKSIGKTLFETLKTRF